MPATPPISESATAATPRHRIISFHDIIHDPAFTPTPLIEGLVPERSITLLVGAPKAGKTFLALEAALALASGGDFLGFPIRQPRRVLFFSAEGGRTMLRARLDKMFGSAATDTQQQCLAVSPVFLNLMEDSDFSEFKQLISDAKPDVVIVDPLVLFHDAEENSSTQMAQLFGRLGQVVDKLGVSLIIVHHTGKDPTRGARGSSVIASSYDAAISLSGGVAMDSARLTFDLRHYASPGTIRLAFDEATLRFSRAPDSSVASTAHASRLKLVSVLRDHPGASKKELVDQLVERGVATSTAYRHVQDAEADGHIVTDDEGRYSVVHGPAPPE